MENNTLKQVYTALAICALCVFLSAPVVTFGRLVNLNGADLLDTLARHDTTSFLWLGLFVAIPICAALTHFSDSIIARRRCAFLMLLPVVALFFHDGNRIGMQMGIGLILYILCSIAMIVISFMNKEEVSSETPSESSSADHSTAKKETPQAASNESNEGNIRKLDNDKLSKIIADASIYNPELVAACRQELEIRKNAGTLLPKALLMEDEQLEEILRKPQMYNPTMVYCCERVLEQRLLNRKKKQKQQEEEERIRHEKEEEEKRIRREKEAEEARIRHEQELKEEQERRAAVWKKRRPYMLGAAMLVLVAAVTIFLHSDMYRYSQGMRHFRKGNNEKAIEQLSRLSSPSYKNYSDAKFILYQLYLQRNDSVAAAKALSASVLGNDWQSDRAYIQYTDYCLDGSFAPYISRNELKAAELLRCSPQYDDRIRSGELFFKIGSYRYAYEVFKQHEESGVASGYLGIMHLYGLNGLGKDAKKAAQLLELAPKRLPFIIHQADLTLFLRKGYTMLEIIKEARDLYQLAYQSEPKNHSYADRYIITANLVKAIEKHSKTNYWNRGSIYWNSYSFKGGIYEGEYTSWGNSAGGHGWGWCKFNSNEIHYGHFQRIKLSGKGMAFVPIGKGYEIQVGDWKNDNLVKGRIISSVNEAQ